MVEFDEIELSPKLSRHKYEPSGLDGMDGMDDGEIDKNEAFAAFFQTKSGGVCEGEYNMAMDQEREMSA